MKIRNGFVSNSSTSSFIIILSKEKYNKLLTEVDSYQKAVLEELGFEEDTILGQRAVIITGSKGNYSSFKDIVVDENLYDPEKVYECYSGCAFEEIKWPSGTYKTEIDCG